MRITPTSQYWESYPKIQYWESYPKIEDNGLKVSITPLIRHEKPAPQNSSRHRRTDTRIVSWSDWFVSQLAYKIQCSALLPERNRRIFLPIAEAWDSRDLGDRGRIRFSK